MVERFARDVARCDKSCRNKLAVETVQSSLQADATYWYPGTSRESFEIAGMSDLPPDGCFSLARKLIDSTPGLDGRLLRSVLPRGSTIGSLQPTSAALVRTSRSHSSWLVALSFGERHFQPADVQIMALVRRILVNQCRSSDMTGRMAETLASLVKCLTTSIDAHVPHTHGHSGRVAQLAVAIGKRMRLSGSVLNDLYFAGLIHDIGITNVPQSLLLKPAKLTEEEFATVKAYPAIGDTILAGIRQLAHLRPAVRHHHERYDGGGYPDGLAGDQIPLMARILGVADSLDAMRSARPYRPALGSAEVDDILGKGAGKQWDPDVVDHYLSGRSHVHALRERPVTPLEPSLQYVMPGFEAESSDKAASGATQASQRTTHRMCDDTALNP
jgi:HD-GYP domain-containing protein (c-di-GMP phosphodiesterase class II)